MKSNLTVCNNIVLSRKAIWLYWSTLHCVIGRTHCLGTPHVYNEVIKTKLWLDRPYCLETHAYIAVTNTKLCLISEHHMFILKSPILRCVSRKTHCHGTPHVYIEVTNTKLCLREDTLSRKTIWLYWSYQH